MVEKEEKPKRMKAEYRSSIRSKVMIKEALLSLMLEKPFDILLINAPLPDDLGMRLAIDTCDSSTAGVLLLVKSELYNDVYAQAVPYGVMTLPKPTSLQMMAQSLRVLCATRERLRKMEERQATVEEKIREIRLLNRAKWHLIESRGMTEAEAHRHIEKQAMDLRLSKGEAAQRILDGCGQRSAP